MCALGSYLHQQHVTFNVCTLGEINDLYHINNLIQMLCDLLDLEVIACGSERQTRQGVVCCWRHIEAFDVVATLRKETHHTRQRAGFVFHQNGKYTSHLYVLSVLLSHMSFMAPLGATCMG